MTEAELRAKFAKIDRERAYYNWRCDNSGWKGRSLFPMGCADNRPHVHVTVDVRGDGLLVDTLLLCESCYEAFTKDVKRKRRLVASRKPSKRPSDYYKVKTKSAKFEG